MSRMFLSKFLCLLLIVFFSVSILTGCIPQTSEKTKEGAGFGAIAGAALGALIDKNNRWRGAVIGAAAGALIIGTAVHISEQAAQQAAATKKPVEYVSDDGVQKVYATPVKSEGKCEWVTVQYYEYGRLVKEERKLVCPKS